MGDIREIRATYRITPQNTVNSRNAKREQSPQHDHPPAESDQDSVELTVSPEELNEQADIRHINPVDPESHPSLDISA
jgi:hypothetical protein